MSSEKDIAGCMPGLMKMQPGTTPGKSISTPLGQLMQVSTPPSRDRDKGGFRVQQIDPVYVLIDFEDNRYHIIGEQSSVFEDGNERLSIAKVKNRLEDFQEDYGDFLIDCHGVMWSVEYDDDMNRTGYLVPVEQTWI